MIQGEINQHLLDWDRIIHAYRDAQHKAAQAETNYHHTRARIIASARVQDPKLSVTAAEHKADETAELTEARAERLASAAEVEAFKQKLYWCRAKADALRSEKVDERESNRLYAENAQG